MNFSLNLKWLEQSGWLVKVSPSKSIQRASLTYFSSHSCYLLPSVPCSTPSPLVEERCGIVGGRGDPAVTRLDQRVHFTIRGACALDHRVHLATRGAWVLDQRGQLRWGLRRNVEMMGSCRYWVCWSLQVLTSSPSGITCNP